MFIRIIVLKILFCTKRRKADSESEILGLLQPIDEYEKIETIDWETLKSICLGTCGSPNQNTNNDNEYISPIGTSFDWPIINNGDEIVNECNVKNFDNSDVSCKSSFSSTETISPEIINTLYVIIEKMNDEEFQPSTSLNDLNSPYLKFYNPPSELELTPKAAIVTAEKEQEILPNQDTASNQPLRKNKKIKLNDENEDINSDTETNQNILINPEKKESKSLNFTEINSSLFKKTFSRLYRFDQNIKISLSENIKIKVVNKTYNVESYRFLRMNRLYKFLTGSFFPYRIFFKSKKDKGSKEKERELQKVTAFFRKYIKNLKFQKETEYYMNTIDRNISLSDLTNIFNTLIMNYFKDIEKTISLNKRSYFETMSQDLRKNKEIEKKEVLVNYFIKFFEDEKYSIFRTLFPEISIFITKLSSLSSLKYVFKRYQIFLNLVVFKFIYLKGMIKFIIQKNRNIPNWLISDSKMILQFIFEMRCTFAFFGFNLVISENNQRFLVYRAFVTFLRLLNFDVAKDTSIFYETFDLIMPDLKNYKLIFLENGLEEIQKSRCRYLKIKKVNDYRILLFFKADFNNIQKEYYEVSSAILKNIKEASIKSKKLLVKTTSECKRYFSNN